MSAPLISSNEFASWINDLHLAPENLRLKQMVVKHLPQMRELAKTNSLALYHLAHIYPPNSSQYKNTMLQAADMGCTNAMLTLAELFAKSDNFEEAAHYIQHIKQSNDSYVIEDSKKLVAQYPKLAKIINQEQEKIGDGHLHRFFPRGKEEGTKNQNIQTIEKCESSYNP